MGGNRFFEINFFKFKSAVYTYVYVLISLKKFFFRGLATKSGGGVKAWQKKEAKKIPPQKCGH